MARSRFLSSSEVQSPIGQRLPSHTVLTVDNVTNGQTEEVCTAFLLFSLDSDIAPDVRKELRH